MWGDRDHGGGKGDRDGKGKGGNRDGGKGRNDDRGGGWGGRSFNDRRQEEEKPTMQSALQGGLGGDRTGPLKMVQIDALVFLQIMKHCRQHTPHAVNGQLLGLDVEDTLQVTHSFGYVQRAQPDEYDRNASNNAVSAEDGAQYQIDTLKKLREVNVDSNTIGWYQTTHLGQFFSSTVIEHQYLYQTEIARSVLLVYDSLQSAIGKPAFKALQLSPEFMKAYREADQAGRAAMADFPSSEMFLEIPVVITASVIAEAFLVDWSISDPFSTTSQVGILDVENQAFLEKNVQLLIGSLQELAEEQNKLIMFEKNAARKGDGPEKGGKGGRDRFNRNTPPRHMDTMILSQQIQNYCNSINCFAGDTFGKIYLMSNKPSSTKK